jgi:energy-coupling factor transporter transmembrane protein EcfT
LPKKIGLTIAVAFSFLPRLFEIWKTIELSYFARGGKRGIVSYIRLLPVLLEKLLEIAGELSLSLLSRSFLP